MQAQNMDARPQTQRRQVNAPMNRNTQILCYVFVKIVLKLKLNLPRHFCKVLENKLHEDSFNGSPVTNVQLHSHCAVTQMGLNQS